QGRGRRRGGAGPTGTGPGRRGGRRLPRREGTPSPAAVLVTITLPPAVGRVSTNETASQPTAGTSPPNPEPIPAPASRQVTRIRAQNPSAASGKLPTLWLNKKHPIRPSTAPSRNSST